MRWDIHIIPYHYYNFIKIFKVKLLRSISISVPRVSSLRKLSSKVVALGFFPEWNPNPTTWVEWSEQLLRLDVPSSVSVSSVKWWWEYNLLRLLLQDNLCKAPGVKQMINRAGALNFRLGNELEVVVRWEIQAEMRMLYWGVQPMVHRPDAAEDGYECGPTQNCKFT